MPILRNIPPETLSFWLGFLAASVFWWLISRIRPLVPRWRSWLRSQIKKSQRKSYDRIDEYFRRETLLQAQKSHLAADLFALDDIIIEPRLLAPPPSFVNPIAQPPDTILQQVISYLPDWPEWSAQYPVPTLTLAEAAQSDANLVIIAQPGAGKTVALAFLASLLARKDPTVGSAVLYTPIMLHVLDLLPDSNSADPLERLIRSISAHCPLMIQSQLPRFIRQAEKDNHLFFLLDGLDELSPPNLDQVSHYLAVLIQKYPGIKIITTGHPSNLDGLVRSGFQPLPMAAWSSQDCRQFIERWRTSWSKLIDPMLEKQTPAGLAVDERLLTGWLVDDSIIDTPLEWTLRIWAAFAGDLSGPSNQDGIMAYLRRKIQLEPFDGVLDALAPLAAEFLLQSCAGLEYDTLEKGLSKIKINPVPAKPAGDNNSKKGQHQPSKNNRNITVSGHFISTLLDAGILCEHSGELIRFSQPALAGFAAARFNFTEYHSVLSDPARWSLRMTTCRYLAAHQPEPIGISGMLALSTSQLQSNLLTVARWLRDTPPTMEWRSDVLRRLVAGVQDEDLAPSLRARMCCALLLSADHSLPALFRQLLNSNAAQVRHLVGLAIGSLQSPRMVDALIGLLADPVPSVRYAACLALSTIRDPRAKDAVPGALLHGDEGLKLAAAEALTGSPEGIEILQEAATLDNTMVRRAAVLAISRIRQEWARKLLEKIAIEDGQWIVRSAAAQAGETYQKADPYLPVRLPIPSGAGWLIAFASKIGVGIPPYQFPLEMLLKVLQTGNSEEKLRALIYLRNQPGEQVTAAILNLVSCETGILRDAGMYALWQMSASSTGLTIPVNYKV